MVYIENGLTNRRNHKNVYHQTFHLMWHFWQSICLLLFKLPWYYSTSLNPEKTKTKYLDYKMRLNKICTYIYILAWSEYFPHQILKWKESIHKCKPFGIWLWMLCVWGLFKSNEDWSLWKQDSQYCKLNRNPE